jgi:uncharacterized protein YxeA
MKKVVRGLVYLAVMLVFVMGSMSCKKKETVSEQAPAATTEQATVEVSTGTPAATQTK